MESKRIVQRTFSGHIRAVHLPLQRLSLTRSTPLQLSPRCIVPVRGKAHPPIAIRSVSGQPIEEYYKWQFINAIVLSGLYPKDYVGVEVHFPKGNKGSAALKLDADIFDDPGSLQRVLGRQHAIPPRVVKRTSHCSRGVQEERQG